MNITASKTSLLAASQVDPVDLPASDPAVITTTLLEHIPALRRYARMLVRSAGAADSLVKDCLDRALSDDQIYRQGDNLRTWLFSKMHGIASAQTTGAQIARRNVSAPIKTKAHIERAATQMIDEVGEEVALAAAVLQAQLAARAGDHRLVADWSRIAEAVADRPRIF